MGRYNKKIGLAIIFHSGSYDRIHHGLSIALTTLALGKEVRLFFSYWALEHLRRGQPPGLRLDKEGEDHRVFIEKSIKKGHMEKIARLLAEAKELGAKTYACVSSMALLNMTRDELLDEVDQNTGIATFLMETEEDQLLFI